MNYLYVMYCVFFFLLLLIVFILGRIHSEIKRVADILAERKRTSLNGKSWMS